MATNSGKVVSAEDVAAAVSAATAAQATALTSAQSRYEVIQSQIQELETEGETVLGQIRTLGGTSGRRSGRRASGNRTAGGRVRNDTSLNVAVANVLLAASGPLSPTEITEAVQKAGYSSTSASNFPQMVSQSLNRMKGMKLGRSAIVANPARGQWQSASGLKGWVKEQTAPAAA